MRQHNSLVDPWIDCGLTLIYWAWFIFGFLLFFSWQYLAAALFFREPEISLQRLNSRFFQIFLGIIRMTAPGQQIIIDKEVAAIRSAVIICNHLSYLDPLLLMALFPRHRTIVKSRFFSLPFFGWVVRKAGYLPSESRGKYASLLIDQLGNMEAYLKSGGNLFVFPEGTRSRDGQLGALQQGALKIARLSQAPIYVLRLRNTDKLFPPGKFLFQTRAQNSISLTLVERIEAGGLPAAQVMERIRAAYQLRDKEVPVIR